MKQSVRVFPLLSILPFLLIFTAPKTTSHDKFKVLSFHKVQSKHHQYQNAIPSCFSRKSMTSDIGSRLEPYYQLPALFHRNTYLVRWRIRKPSQDKSVVRFKPLFDDCGLRDFARREDDSTTFEMMHRDFCSRKTIHDLNKRLQGRITLDDNQVQFLQYRMKNLILGELETVSDTQMPLSSGTRLEILNYVVTMTLGRTNMTVIVDTGSDLTWVQCQPCSVCYSQLEPIFNPSTSLSFQSLSCNSSACRSLQEATGSSDACAYSPSTCNYYINYGDGSYTRGELATDRLDMGKTHVDNFTFGCGRSNKGLFGSASGLMGLGKSNLSLVYQTIDQFGGVFSYCLPSSDAGESGSLTLGGNSSAYRNTTPIAYTRMVQNPQLPSFYMLNLTGIAVGGVHLNAPTFRQNAVLIDSGTVITRLPPSIYRVLKAEFVKQLAEFQTAPEFSILDTCFNLSSFNEAKIPTVKLHFEGNAELNVDVNGVVYFAKSDASQACLAFASLRYEDEVPIIGNYQQKNIRVVYDTKHSLVGFAEEKCSF